MDLSAYSYDILAFRFSFDLESLLRVTLMPRPAKVLKEMETQVKMLRNLLFVGISENC